jgi:hypothetical protein
MPNVNNWTAGSDSAASRAEDAWNRIQEKATSVVIRRAGVALAAQTVRLEMDDAFVSRTGANTDIAEQKIVVFGVRNHATITNTDIQRKDRLTAFGAQWEIELVIVQTGEVQGVGKRVA